MLAPRGPWSTWLPTGRLADVEMKVDWFNVFFWSGALVFCGVTWWGVTKIGLELMK